MSVDDGRPVIVQHRVRFHESQVEVIERAGARVVSSGSLGQTERALERGGVVVVVVDLSAGSATPERVVELCRAAKVAVIACRSGILRTSDRRAQKLGIDKVYSFPEGAFVAVLAVFSAAPSFSLRRVSERARLDGVAGGDLDGRLVNISAGGALVEADDLRPGTEVTLSLAVPGLAAPREVTARVCWREAQSPGRARLGLEFVGVSDDMREGIDAYVRRANAVQVSPPAPPRPRAQSVRVRREGAARLDYFQLQRDGDDELLVPRRQFFVPWSPGDNLCVRAAGQEERTVQIVERLLLEPGRADGRVAWRIRGTTPPSP